jgi:hypothetical protein
MTLREALTAALRSAHIALQTAPEARSRRQTPIYTPKFSPEPGNSEAGSAYVAAAHLRDVLPVTRRSFRPARTRGAHA